MVRNSLFALAFLLFMAANSAQAGTIVKDEATHQKLRSVYGVALQWISWDHFGRAEVTEKDGTLFLTGKQSDAGTGDYVTVDGVIEEIDTNAFVFNGTVVTKVNFIANGQPCQRSGRMLFKKTRNRRYWRLQSINNPCDSVADYVDVFFKPPQFSLTVQPDPEDALVRVLNIGPKYQPGMKLEPGKYHIEVSRPGMATRKQWLEIVDQDLTVNISLLPESVN